MPLNLKACISGSNFGAIHTEDDGFHSMFPSHYTGNNEGDKKWLQDFLDDLRHILIRNGCSPMEITTEIYPLFDDEGKSNIPDNDLLYEKAREYRALDFSNVFREDGRINILSIDPFKEKVFGEYSDRSILFSIFIGNNQEPNRLKCANENMEALIQEHFQSVRKWNEEIGTRENAKKTRDKKGQLKEILKYKKRHR